MFALYEPLRHFVYIGSAVGPNLLQRIECGQMGLHAVGVISARSLATVKKSSGYAVVGGVLHEA